MSPAAASLLKQLANLYGIQTTYRNVAGRARQATPDALLAVLQALGVGVEEVAGVPAALQARYQEIWHRACEPVVVIWEGKAAHLLLRLPACSAGRGTCHLRLEDGTEQTWNYHLEDLPVLRMAAAAGTTYVVRQLNLPARLPRGYHRLTQALPGDTWETLVICAPPRAYLPPHLRQEKSWGVFLPLYALRSRQDWGTGSFTDLYDLLAWTRELGGSFVGTLPLLAAFLDEPYAPSPYAPASRLFWNEIYLDVTRVPEWPACPAAQELFKSVAFQQELAALRDAPQVDYHRLVAVKRHVLALLAHHLRSSAGERRTTLEQWAAAHPAALDYAHFRATMERQRSPWPAWPARLRDERLEEGDYDPEAAYYHLYVQWLAEEQMASFQGAGAGKGLYLDFPLGVHPAGYDVWRERSCFALEASAGAPPDAFFPEGQDWGLPPLRPQRLREQGYRYYIACLRHQMRHADILRLDHVMAGHRLFWISRGFTPEEGVYVRYPAEEFYAILALESHRHQTVVVGEDLGTVPRYVRTAMARHGVQRLSVLQLEFNPCSREVLRPAPAASLASLNTHDTPTFAAFWQSRAAEQRAALAQFFQRLGWLPYLTDDAAALLAASLTYLAASPARLIVVNLEDLWLETAPQNIPGTVGENFNWRRKARYLLEDLSAMPTVLQLLQKVHQQRQMSREGKERKGADER